MIWNTHVQHQALRRLTKIKKMVSKKMPKLAAPTKGGIQKGFSKNTVKEFINRESGVKFLCISMIMINIINGKYFVCFVRSEEIKKQRFSLPDKPLDFQV